MLIPQLFPHTRAPEQCTSIEANCAFTAPSLAMMSVERSGALSEASRHNGAGGAHPLDTSAFLSPTAMLADAGTFEHPLMAE